VLLIVGLTDVALICGGLILANQIYGNDAFTAAGICASAVVTILGLVYYLTTVRGESSAESFRHSIAATFVLVYLILVTISAFPDQSADTTDSSSSLPPITGTLLNNFTTLAGIIAAFYFGGTIVEKWRDRDEARVADSTPDQPSASEASTDATETDGA
jgi:protein-S-isoprenylcysteine O-methyltransferase Ste14